MLSLLTLISNLSQLLLFMTLSSSDVMEFSIKWIVKSALNALGTVATLTDNHLKQESQRKQTQFITSVDFVWKQF